MKRKKTTILILILLILYTGITSLKTNTEEQVYVPEWSLAAQYADAKTEIHILLLDILKNPNCKGQNIIFSPLQLGTIKNHIEKNTILKHQYDLILNNLLQDNSIELISNTQYIKSLQVNSLWDKKFKAYTLSKDKLYHTLSQSTELDFMVKENIMRYYENDILEAANFPISDTLDITIVLPKLTLEKTLEYVDNGIFDELNQGYDIYNLELILPKLQINTDIKNEELMTKILASKLLDNDTTLLYHTQFNEYGIGNTTTLDNFIQSDILGEPDVKNKTLVVNQPFIFIINQGMVPIFVGAIQNIE